MKYRYLFFTFLFISSILNVQANEIIVDNQDTEFSTTGTWSESGAFDEYAGSSLWSKTISSTATWTPNLPEASLYHVYVWYSGSTSYDRNSNANYTVNYDTGSEVVIIDQDQGSGAWVSLGIFSFNAGNSGNVTLFNHVSLEGSSADAVRFVSVQDTEIPPTADAGFDKSVQVNNTVTITGSGTDTDGTIVSYEWTKDGTFVADTASFEYTATALGTYTFTLTVTDNNGATGTDDMNVTVTEDPIPTTEIIIDNQDTEFTTTGTWAESGAPDEYAGSSIWSKTISSTATWTPNLPEASFYHVYVWYSGSTSYDRNSNANYTVNYDVGSEVIIIDQDQGSGDWVSLGIFSFNAGNSGNVSLFNHVYLEGSSADAVRFVSVQDTGIPPTADAGADQSVETGTVATFDGSGSNDTDGDPLTYSWSIISQPAGSTATLTNPTAISPTFTPDVDGEYVVQLIVNDGTVNSAADSVTVTASTTPPANTPPTADAGFDKSVQVNNTVTITGSGTDTDGTIVSYEWTKDGAFVADTASFDYTATAPGTYTLTLTVTDNNGTTGTDDMNVTVTEDPVATNEIIVDNQDAEFSTTGTWSESGAFDEYAGSSIWSKTISSTATWTPNLPEASLYHVYVWYSGSTSYDRNSNANYTVNYNAGSEVVIIDQDQGSGDWVSLGIFSFNAGNSGNVTLFNHVSVEGSSADAVRFVSVQDAGNIPPTADAGFDKSVQVTNTLTITGSGADTDGTIVSYEWTKDGAFVADTASFEYTATLPGTYTFTLTVTDNDGATGTDDMNVTVTEAPVATNEIIVDNQDVEFSTTGTWAESVANDEYAGSSIWSKTISSTATWTPNLPEASLYQVYVWYSGSTSYDRNSNANYTVNYDVGSEIIIIDQDQGSGDWVSLGIFSFNAGNSGNVSLFNHVSLESSSADAVRFVPIKNGAIVEPMSGYIQSGNSIITKAKAKLAGDGWGVKFILDEGKIEEQSDIDIIDPYQTIFYNLIPGEHTIDMYIVDDSGNIQAGEDNHDRVFNIGTGGQIIVALGDSITEGSSDDIASDDTSIDERNSKGGFEPILNNLLTQERGYPHSVLNEGISGETSEDGLSRLPGILTNYPEATTYLIMFGTNDANPCCQVPVETYRNNMQQMINMVKEVGKQPILAKIPRVMSDYFTDPTYIEQGIDPEDGTRNIKIRDYNTVIDELVSSNDITVIPPEFYTYFKNTYGDTYSVEVQDGYADNFHPDNLGYNAMAELWTDALITQTISPDTQKPIITLIGGDITLTINGTYTEQGATAYDNEDGDITENIVISGAVDTTSVGSYTITYYVSDTAANVSDIISRTVTVEDATTEMLLYDDSFKFSISDKGFHILIDSGEIPASSWLAPHDFYNGEMRIRYIVQSPAGQEAGGLQTCIWTKINGNISGNPESCSDYVSHNGVGTYYTSQLVPETWWKKTIDGIKEPLDFEHPEYFMFRSVLRGQPSSCVVTTWPVDGACPEQYPNYENMVVRVTIVMVADGTTFSGWENYPE